MYMKRYGKNMMNFFLKSQPIYNGFVNFLNILYLYLVLEPNILIDLKLETKNCIKQYI